MFPQHPGLPAAPQRVVLTVGLPGSGKSTWLERRGIIPLASDHLRLLVADDVNEQRFQAEIFEGLRVLLELRLRIGRPVSYIDATNLLAVQRAPFLELARRWGCPADALFFDVPLEICLARNRRRERQVPDEVMREMAARLEPPALTEGFRQIIRIDAEGRELAGGPAQM